MKSYYAGQVLFPLLSITHLASSTVSHTNCTIPEQTAEFVSGPNVRSTLDILYTSLVTIFLCTWTAQHLCLPADHSAEPWLVRIWLSIWRKLKWMMVAIVMPEFLVGKALGEIVAAYRSSRCEDMQRALACSKQTDPETEWTMTHAFYANMGGFNLVLGPPPVSKSTECLNNPHDANKNRTFHDVEQSSSNNDSHKHVWGLRNILCSETSIWRREHKDWNDGPIPALEGDGPSFRDFPLPISINSAQICLLLSKGIIPRLPSISYNSIEDKSKEDLLVKIVTLGQVTWFVIQLIARKINGLPSTQLEIAVLGFALCTFVTYLLWLKKPKDIKFGTEIQTIDDRPLDEDTRKRLVWLNKYGFFENALYTTSVHKPSLVIANDMYHSEAQIFSFSNGWGITYEDVGVLLGAVMFGACHCFAWNFQFPTLTEQTVWRVASLFTIAALPVFYYISATFRWLDLPTAASNALAHVTYATYTICRLFIIGELFRTLAYLPPEAFLATWSASIPHVN